MNMLGNGAFKTFGEQGTGEHLLGFELELEHPDGDKIVGHFSGFPELPEGYLYAFTWEDSVSRGGEFISNPASLATHRKLLPTFVQCLRKAEFTANPRTCGLHVHVSLDVLGEAGLARLVSLSIFGGAPWENLQRKVMGRIGRTWAPPLNGAHGRPSRLENASDWLEATTDEKFVRLNLCHPHTIEFRQGCASTQLARILGRMEFAEALCVFAEARPQVDTPEAEVADFLGFLESHQYGAALALATA